MYERTYMRCLIRRIFAVRMEKANEHFLPNEHKNDGSGMTGGMPNWQCSSESSLYIHIQFC